MKKIAFLFLLILFSCKEFIKETPNEQVVYENELKKVDYNHVDQYPSFEICNGKQEAEKRKCFFETLSEEIRIKLSTDSLQKLLIENNLDLKVKIDKEANLTFKTILKDTLNSNAAKVDSIISEKLIDFSAIIPAKNKGVFVTTEFQMTIKLK